MSATTSYDFAIFGSTPLAGLVAGLLAAVHRRRVCIVGEVFSPFRLPRGFDVSAMPVTRPETWALLQETTSETLRLLRQVAGRAAFRRIDPVWVADTPAGIDALSHVRHVAAGYGCAVERLGAFGLGENAVAYRVRDAAVLDRAQLAPAIARWLTACPVRQLAASDVRVALRRDGGARIEGEGIEIEAEQAVLLDDTAILERLDGGAREPALMSRPVTSLLTEPTRPLPAPLMVFVDGGVTLSQARGGIAALCDGPPEQAMARAGGRLAGNGGMRRVGEAGFRALASLDGAPVIGRSRGQKAWLAAGLGTAGAFMAPAVARLLAGAATEAEGAYFAARDAARGADRRMVAEFTGRALEPLA